VSEDGAGRGGAAGRVESDLLAAVGEEEATGVSVAASVAASAVSVAAAAEVAAAELVGNATD
jgi:hypothetical protein